MQEKYSWYNFKKEQYEIIATPEDFAEYIPQSQASQGLYRLYIEHLKLAPIEAAIKVLEACAGIKKEDK